MQCVPGVTAWWRWRASADDSPGALRTTAHGLRDPGLGLFESVGSLRIGHRELRQPFTEEATRTHCIATEEAARTNFQRDFQFSAGQIGQRAPIAAMHPTRRHLTQGASRRPRNTYQDKTGRFIRVQFFRAKQTYARRKWDRESHFAPPEVGRFTSRVQRAKRIFPQWRFQKTLKRAGGRHQTWRRARKIPNLPIIFIPNVEPDTPGRRHPVSSIRFPAQSHRR